MRAPPRELTREEARLQRAKKAQARDAESLKRWQTKLKRATNAIKKLRRRLRTHERLMPKREQMAHVSRVTARLLGRVSP